MKLEKITLKNFLTYHDRVEIDLSKSRTIVVGANDSGKSNLVRFLYILTLAEGWWRSLRWDYSPSWDRTKESLSGIRIKLTEDDREFIAAALLFHFISADGAESEEFQEKAEKIGELIERVFLRLCQNLSKT
ncbi:MAG: AAA family ATPase [Candidatus Heimdallarchaeota archaeon]